MSVRVYDERYETELGTERERFVSGQFNRAAVYDDHAYVGIGGVPDLDLTWDRVRDLRDVLDAALELIDGQ